MIYNRFKNDVFGLLFIAAALFVALALGSFNPQDPSFNSLGQGIVATNLCGYVGSFLSDLLFQLFGLSAWFFVFGLVKAALIIFKNQEINAKNMRLIFGASLLINLSALVSIYFSKPLFYSEQIYFGGIVGLGISQLMIQVFNKIGAQLILWTSTFVFCLFFSEKTIDEIIGYFHEKISFLKNKSTVSIQKLKKNKTEEVVKTENKINFNILPSVEAEKLILNEGSNFPLKKTSFSLSEKLNDDKKHDINISENKLKLEIKTEVPTLSQKLSFKNEKSSKVENWHMPKMDLLETPPHTRVRIDEKDLKKKSEILTNKFEQFAIAGQVVSIKPGPVVTMFEFKPNADVKLSKITELADDLSMALSSESLRIIAPIPGRDVVGIETSNSQRETVFLKDLLADPHFWSEDFKLPIALGRQANGEPKIVDLRKMPHLLVAGTTGSGKSVFTVSSICGLLLKHSPKTLKLILVDPKQVDLAAFTEIPHLIMPTVNEPKKAVSALRWAIREMEKRYRSMKKFNVRSLEHFNEAVAKLKSDALTEHENFNNENTNKTEDYYYEAQPYIVIVVEEFGDLMAVDKVNVEQAVVRLAQMARACGIHLILAMQSPRKEVVTGLIKTNIPGRISFKVASKMDSRIILDEGGAERLLAHGDMLFLSPGVAKPMRHHGPFLKESEITNIAKFWSSQAPPQFDELALKTLEGKNSDSDFQGSDDDDNFSEEEYDEKYDEILAWTAEQKDISASLIQRRFRLGYPRAARIIEVFEKEGIVSAANGSKPRQVIVNNLRS